MAGVRRGHRPLTPDACVGANDFDVCEAEQAKALRDLVARRRDVRSGPA